MPMLHHHAVGLVEYRRHPWDPGVLRLECRLLRADGTPYDDRWYPVTDESLAAIQRDGAGRDLIRRLWVEPDPAAPPPE